MAGSSNPLRRVEARRARGALAGTTTMGGGGGEADGAAAVAVGRDVEERVGPGEERTAETGGGGVASGAGDNGTIAPTAGGVATGGGGWA